MTPLDAPWLAVLADASRRGAFGDHLVLDGDMFDTAPTADEASRLVWDRRLVEVGGWLLRMGCKLHFPRGHLLRASFKREA